jgi:hypothetical protein
VEHYSTIGARGMKDTPFNNDINSIKDALEMSNLSSHVQHAILNGIDKLIAKKQLEARLDEQSKSYAVWDYGDAFIEFGYGNNGIDQEERIAQLKQQIKEHES